MDDGRVNGNDGVNNDRKDLPQLRFQFVSMLFALAIVQVALKFAELVNLGLTTEAYAGYAQMFLATAVITTSWVGWGTHATHRDRDPVRSVFTLAFFVLLIDVAIVVFYFILVERTEGKGAEPSATPDAKWMLVIFAGYLIWDLVPKTPALPGKAWPSVLCVFLAAITFSLVLAWDLKGWIAVVIADVALLLNVILFRWLRHSVSRSRLPVLIIGSAVFALLLFGTLFAAHRFSDDSLSTDTTSIDDAWFYTG